MQLLPEPASKTSISVRDDGRGKTVQLEDVVEELVCDVNGCSGGSAGDKVCELGELVDKHCDGIEFPGCGRERPNTV